MAFDVTVNIKLTQPIGKVGTWFPLLYVVDSESTSDTYKEYTKLEDVKKDYPDITSEEKSVPSEAYKSAELIFMQNDAPSKIAILKQSAFSTETFAPYLTRGFRQIVLVGTHSNIGTIAAYIETTDRMLFVTTKDTTTDETLWADATKKYDRTFVVVHETEGENAAAAVVGATAGYAAGSFTYKNIIIKGVTPSDYSDTELKAIHDLNGIAIVEKAGDIVTSEGTVRSGEYADIIDSKDYVIQNISYNVQKVFNTNKKVPYTNNGIALLEAATLEALADGFANGMIASTDDDTPDYSVSFALRSQTTETDRAARDYPYGQFSFGLAGAIHTATINGTISY